MVWCGIHILHPPSALKILWPIKYIDIDIDNLSISVKVTKSLCNMSSLLPVLPRGSPNSNVKLWGRV